MYLKVCCCSKQDEDTQMCASNRDFASKNRENIQIHILIRAVSSIKITGRAPPEKKGRYDSSENIQNGVLVAATTGINGAS